MGWRFRKRIKILPGIHLNVSKSGISTNIGIKGASITFGSKGTYVNTGLPGTGLYRRDKISNNVRNSARNDGIPRIDINSKKNIPQEKKCFKKANSRNVLYPTFKSRYYFLYIIALLMPFIGITLYGYGKWWMFFSCLIVDFCQLMCWCFVIDTNDYHNNNSAYMLVKADNETKIRKEITGHVRRCALSGIIAFLNLFPIFAMNERFISFYDNLFGLIFGLYYFHHPTYDGGFLVFLMMAIMMLLWGGNAFIEIESIKRLININAQIKPHYNDRIVEEDLTECEIESISSDSITSENISNDVRYVDKEEAQTRNQEDSVIEINKKQEKKEYKDNNTSIKFEEISTSGLYNPKLVLETYHYPTLNLLKTNEFDDKPYINVTEQNIYKNRLVDTLRYFGIEISSIKSTVGPRITLYEITPAPGISASEFRGLEDDIALALCSHNVQIIIPLPGKGTIGIEVPNPQPSILSMKSVLNTTAFQETTMELPCVIGTTLTNNVFMFDLVKSPHVLIAGSTGQGKSIMLNALILSLLYKKHPAELKFVLMDSYGVEFGGYSLIANHFLASLSDCSPIISNSSEAIRTLNSLCMEMDARYELLKKAYARNIKEYNRKFIELQLNPANGHRYMPYIVVIIDEYGDFIEENGLDFESPIIQLTQYARAVGIHLIISTKRPTNNIITGAIKANFPTRIAFRLPERIDSQIILDCDGAEELLGNGDMLYRAGKSIDCIRVQGAFADTSEIERVNTFISNQQGYKSTYELADPDFNEEDYYVNDDDMRYLDPMFEDAARLIVREQSGSTSLIQRKFAIGYNRASRLMDQLEKAGIVACAHGSKPREVLLMDETSLENLLSCYRGQATDILI